MSLHCGDQRDMDVEALWTPYWDVYVLLASSVSCDGVWSPAVGAVGG